MTTKRDYKKEYREYHGKPEQIAARSQRNAARAKVGLAVGDKKRMRPQEPHFQRRKQSKGQSPSCGKEHKPQEGGEMIDILGPISFLASEPSQPSFTCLQLPFFFPVIRKRVF